MDLIGKQRSYYTNTATIRTQQYYSIYIYTVVDACFIRGVSWRVKVRMGMGCVLYVANITHVDYWYLDIYKASALIATPQYKLLQ